KADDQLVIVGAREFLQAVYLRERLHVVRVQKHGAGPDCRLRERRARVLREHIPQSHAIACESIKIRGEINARVVGTDIIRTDRIDDKDENIWPSGGRWLQVLN